MDFSQLTRLIANSTYRELGLRAREYLQYQNAGGEERDLSQITMYNCDEAQTRGTDFGWELQTVPGVGHDGEEMAVPAADLFRLDYEANNGDNPVDPPQPTTTNLVWEEQGLVDKNAVATGSSFNLSDGTTVTVDWDIEMNGGDLFPNNGDDFVSYEDGLGGNHQGYLNVGFNNSESDPNDIIGVSLNFDGAVTGLNFDVLDVDEGSSFDDAVEIFVDGVNIFSTDDFGGDPSGQSIGISDLQWSATGA